MCGGRSTGQLLVPWPTSDDCGRSNAVHIAGFLQSRQIRLKTSRWPFEEPTEDSFWVQLDDGEMFWTIKKFRNTKLISEDSHNLNQINFRNQTIWFKFEFKKVWTFESRLCIPYNWPFKILRCPYNLMETLEIEKKLKNWANFDSRFWTLKFFDANIGIWWEMRKFCRTKK